MPANAHWKDEPDEHDYPAAADYLSLVMPEDGGSLRGIERTLGVRLERASVSGIAMADLAASEPVARQSIARLAHGGAHRKNSGSITPKERSSSGWRRRA